MNEEEVLAYVRASARALELPLDDTRARAVAQHLGRTAVLAKALDAYVLPPEIEPAEVYLPAPFPTQEGA